MPQHFIEKCEDCDTVLAQCRCPDKNKYVIWDLCATCKAVREKKAAAARAGLDPHVAR
jgi:hypothetical protein